MELNPISYEKFIMTGEIVFEISEKMLLEKVILQILGMFSVAAEMRFLEKENKIEKNNNIILSLNFYIKLHFIEKFII